MKILVGNNRLNKPGGSETYTYAIVEELIKQGHTVHCITSGNFGIVSSKIEELGVPVFFKPIGGNYDLALLSHSTSIELCKNVKAFKVQTCHGIFPALEQPIKEMNAYVAITEEVQGHLKKKGFNSTIIYNGINCEKFQSKSPINNKLKTVLSLTHSKKANVMIKEACNQIGCDLIVHDKFNNSRIWNMSDLINSVDLVIGVGRSIYEAAACERNVVVFDYRNYINKPLGDGILTEIDFPDYLKNNCTGRYSKNVFSVNQLVFELALYNPFSGKRLRDFVLKNMNIKKQVQKYLNLV